MARSGQICYRPHHFCVDVIKQQQDSIASEMQPSQDALPSPSSTSPEFSTGHQTSYFSNAHNAAMLNSSQQFVDSRLSTHNQQLHFPIQSTVALHHLGQFRDTVNTFPQPPLQQPETASYPADLNFHSSFPAMIEHAYSQQSCTSCSKLTEIGQGNEALRSRHTSCSASELQHNVSGGHTNTGSCTAGLHIPENTQDSGTQLACLNSVLPQTTGGLLAPHTIASGQQISGSSAMECIPSTPLPQPNEYDNLLAESATAIANFKHL